MAPTDHIFIPDDSQRKVIDAHGGYHLVLAPPGCGKTQILTERIVRAHAQGMPYGNMLCLTFTNRAARGMHDRIASDIGEEDVRQIFVGNIHRFCSKLLFEQNVVSSESSIIDDDDAISIVARYANDDELAVATDGRRRYDYNRVIQLSHYLRQVLRHTPKELRLHPESLDANDIAALRVICEKQRMDFNQQALEDIYVHTDFYRQALNGDAYNIPLRGLLVQTLQRFQLARDYERYKQENLLIDFEDLLILTYDFLTTHPKGEYPHYQWIQIDEVQDLNPLQLKIIDLITSADLSTVMYLGDEQQAIFSFMGARLGTLDALKDRCKGHIHHLGENHRSPKYLLDVFNEYAASVLHIDPVLLPVAVNDRQQEGGDLLVRHSATLETEYADVARTVEWLNRQNATASTAVIVNSNRDADEVSRTLDELRISHFKVSGADLFASPEMKLLFAHLNVLVNEHCFISWARLLCGLHVFETSGAGRNFVQAMKRCAMLPSDLLLYDGDTYVHDFVRCWEERELVIFDTETTGLNVFEDDIVQIAAVKVRRGEVVAGSELSLFMETDRPIPEMLGDIVNPIIEERKHHPLLSHAEGLRRFLDYAGNGILLGHNADYDYHILDNNLRRYLPSENLHERLPKYFDSLKLIRMLRPDLLSFKLKDLLSCLHLEGENAHLADADVDATRSLAGYCYQTALEKIPLQEAFMQRRRVIDRGQAFCRLYRDMFLQAREKLWQRASDTDGEPILVREMNRVYKQLFSEGIIRRLRGIDYVSRYLACDLIHAAEEPSLVEQLSHHIIEMSTLKEADLCSSSSMTERVFVTTVHKAKGLEFDNVIVFDAVDGRYPNYYGQDDPAQVAEDARKFYVAMSRARKRLIVWQSDARLSSRGDLQPKQLTRFMQPILRFFEER